MPRRSKAPTGPLPGTAAALKGVIDFAVDGWGHPLGLLDDLPLPRLEVYGADPEVKRRFMRFVEDGKVVLAGHDVTRDPDEAPLLRFGPADLGSWDFDLLRETATPARAAPRGTPPMRWLLPLSPATWARACALPARRARTARQSATLSYTVVVAWALLQADVALERRGYRQKLERLRDDNARAYGFDPAVFDEALGVLPRGLKLGVGKKR